MLAPTCLPLTCPEAGGSVELLSMGVSLVCRLSLKTGFCVASSGGKAWGVGGGEVNPLWGNVEISAVQSLSS